jgi:double-stranded uracil-DNA glycosylase
MIKEGFNPIAGTTPAVLILGTFPSEESLKQNQYYAHPRNQFWEMIAAICGTGRHDEYEKRCERARSKGIAIWDVLKSCDREGSSDGRIRRGHFIPNDIGGFLLEHPVSAIFFNGTKAALLFKQHVDLSILPVQPRLMTLPSTSPAHAALSKQQKLERWLEVKTYLTTQGQPAETIR